MATTNIKADIKKVVSDIQKMLTDSKSIYSDSAAQDLAEAEAALCVATDARGLYAVAGNMVSAIRHLGWVVGGLDVDWIRHAKTEEAAVREMNHLRGYRNHPPMEPGQEQRFKTAWGICPLTDEVLSAWAEMAVAEEKAKLAPGEFCKMDLSYVKVWETRECGGNTHSDCRIPEWVIKPLRSAGAAISTSRFDGGGIVYVVVGGHLVKSFKSCCCQWWDDSHNDFAVVGGEGVTLTEGGWSEEFDDDEKDSSLYERIGAFKDVPAAKKREEAEAAAARRERYEAAKERAELLYPYVGARVFKAHIRWALEEDVAEAAIALARHMKWLAPHLRPLGGWQCHYKRISAAWHAAYGWNSESALDALLGVCSKISQPRLDAAWQIANILSL